MVDISSLVDRLRTLNTDHHRRMTALHNSRKGMPAGNAIGDLNQSSRTHLSDAMRGCAARFGFGKFSGRLLELGASYGGEREFLVNTFQTAYVGVEVVTHVAEAAKDMGVLHMALEEAPEEWDGSFDWIYSRHVMEHVPNADVAISTLKRVLAPLGIIGAVTPNDPDNEPAHICQLRLEQWMVKYRQHGLIPVFAAHQQHPGLTEAHVVCVHKEALKNLLTTGLDAEERKQIQTILQG